MLLLSPIRVGNPNNGLPTLQTGLQHCTNVVKVARIFNGDTSFADTKTRLWVQPEISTLDVIAICFVINAPVISIEGEPILVALYAIP